MELRKILFSKDEVTAAAVGYARAVGRPVPNTPWQETRIADDPQATVVVSFGPGRQAVPPLRLTLRRDEVCEALVRYCLDHRVPLPAAGRKVLWPQPDGISLMITLTIVTEPSDLQATRTAALSRR
jgi:hypothetical protein